MTVLVAMLGAVLCSLTVSSQVVPQADLDVQRLTGKWYLIGVATNAQWFVTSRAGMKMATATVSLTADGDQDISYAMLKPDGSYGKRNICVKKTDTPGKFMYSDSGNVNDVSVVDVKYDEYIILHIIETNRSDAMSVNKLYGRGMEVSPDVVEKFKQFSLKNGVLPENIVIFLKNAECPAA